MNTRINPQSLWRLLTFVAGICLHLEAMAQAPQVSDPPVGPPMVIRPGKPTCCSYTASSGQSITAAGTSGGSLGNPIRCDQSIEFNGGFPEHAKFWQLPSSRGAFTLSFDFYSIPDTMDIYQGGILIFTTGGLVNGAADVTVPFGFGGNREVLVVVNEGDNSDMATAWTYSISCQPEDDFTVVDVRDSHEVQQGDVLYIEGQDPPTMPQLVARLGNGFAVSDTASWIFDCINPHPKRKGPDRKKDLRHLSMQMPVGYDWEINPVSGDYFGGDATVEVELTGFDKRTVDFKIRGKNPANPLVIAFIGRQSGAPWYFQYIAQHESRIGSRIFNQFYPAGSLEGQAVWGKPDGWGMMQVDSKRGRPITTGEVWSWQYNVLAGLQIVRQNTKEAVAYFAAIQRKYPAEYESPPSLALFPDINETIDPVDAAAIQLFNGASVVLKLPTIFGTTSQFRSCWRFYPKRPSGQRWEFKDNKNGYVHAIYRERKDNPGGVE